MSDLTPADIRAMLQGRADALARELAPVGRREGPLWSAENPRWGDRHKGSFKVYLSGPKAGGFVEYRGDNERGDVIHLIAYCQGVGDWRGREGVAYALAWAKRWLGLEAAGPKALAQVKSMAAEAARRLKADEAGAEARKRRRAFEIWRDAGPLDALGGVARTYLEDVRRSGPLRADEDLRLHPRLAHWVSPKPWPEFPAIIAAARDATGAVVAVHCTYLAHDGSAKAPVTGAQKLVLGPVAGAAAHLSRGGGPAAHEDSQARPVLLCEGIETGRTLASSTLEDGTPVGDAYRVVAGLSLTNMGNFPIAATWCGDVLVNLETTQSRATATQQQNVLCRLVTRARPGQAVKELTTPNHYSDFNDMAMES
jgi:hypothetical protein